MDRTEKMKSLYRITNVLLDEMVEEADIKNLNSYLTPEKCTKIEDFYEQALSSLCNYRTAKKLEVIGFDRSLKKNRVENRSRIERHKLIKTILCDFNPLKVKETFGEKLKGEKFEKLIGEFNKNKDKLKLKKTIESNKPDSWVRFGKGAISAANFLSNHQDDFRNDEAFNNYVKGFESSPEALPMLLSDKKSGDRIFGFGFALACDFLKEAGYDYYAKPDRQLIGVFKGVGLCESDDVYKAFKTAIDMATKTVGKTAYEVDKRIWLVCTGNFYLDDKKVAGKKKELIHCVRHIEHESCKICLFTHPA